MFLCRSYFFFPHNCNMSCKSTIPAAWLVKLKLELISIIERSLSKQELAASSQMLITLICFKYKHKVLFCFTLLSRKVSLKMKMFLKRKTESLAAVACWQYHRLWGTMITPPMRTQPLGRSQLTELITGVTCNTSTALRCLGGKHHDGRCRKERKYTGHTPRSA